MGRRPFIAGNWKMYKTATEAVALIQDLGPLIESAAGEVDVAVIPPFTALESVSAAIGRERAKLFLGAQDVHWESEGAFTGAVAPGMLEDLGVAYVIVGHSERREYFGDTDEVVNKKVHAVLGNGMGAIVCVGEPLGVYDEGGTEDFVRGQVRKALADLSIDDMSMITIAYEPIWAIGTGRTPTPESANNVARTIRATVGAMFCPPVAMELRIQYGGSVKPDNAALFMSEPDIDGALVGGAALDARSFADIVDAAR